MIAVMGGTETQTLDKIAAGADEIIERAARHKVSDIHIEPGPRFLLIRYRQGGALYIANKLPLTHAAKLARHFKKQAKLDAGNVAEPQIGNYELKLGRKVYNLQVATLPVIGGEKITIRLHELEASTPSPELLGLWGPNLDNIRRTLTAQRGLVIVAGRQANYLNVTLTALMQTLASSTLKTAFVNNGNLPLPLNVKQVTVRPAAGLDAATQLAILGREHLDVLGVSHINETAAVREALAAAEHSLVLAGLLADSAVTGLKIIQQMYPKTLTPPAVLGQCFARRLCEHCREAYELAPPEHQQLALLFQTNHAATIEQLHELEKAAKTSGLGANEPLGSGKEAVKKLWRAKPHGCSRCDHTGYAGEIGIFEFCQPNAALQKALLEHEPLNALQKLAIKDGMISLQVDALIKTLRGLIDLPTCLSVCALTVIK